MSVTTGDYLALDGWVTTDVETTAGADIKVKAGPRCGRKSCPHGADIMCLSFHSGAGSARKAGRCDAVQPPRTSRHCLPVNQHAHAPHALAAESGDKYRR